MLAYVGGTQEILGQWFESVPQKEVTIRDVYTSHDTDSRLEKLRFVLCKKFPKTKTVLRQITAVFSTHTRVIGDIGSDEPVAAVRDINYGVSIATSL